MYALGKPTLLAVALSLAVAAPALAKTGRVSHHATRPTHAEHAAARSAEGRARDASADAPADTDPLALDMHWIDVPDGAAPPPDGAGGAPDSASGGATGIARQMAGWISANDDNQGMPFAIVDKLAARIFVYAADGSPMGSAPILLGLARGDDSAPGVGELKLAQISAANRTTPAGRFVARYGPSDGHGTMLWVDLPDAISMHPVMSVNAGEHRLQRIKSDDPAAHRISYGCINLPAKFYDAVVEASFGAAGGGVVYILPDTKTLAEVFPRFAAAQGEGEDDRPARDARWDPLADPPDHIPGPPRLAAEQLPDER